MAGFESLFFTRTGVPNMLRRIVVGFLLVGAGFCGGLYVGYRYIAWPRGFMAAVGESFMAQQYAMLRYREGSYPEAVAAVEAYIAYLGRTPPIDGEWKPGDSPWLDAHGQLIDTTMMWARLALLHEVNSNPTAAEVAWGKAESLAAMGTWDDPSREHLRAIVLRLDGSPQGERNPNIR